MVFFLVFFLEMFGDKFHVRYPTNYFKILNIFSFPLGFMIAFKIDNDLNTKRRK